MVILTGLLRKDSGAGPKFKCPSLNILLFLAFFKLNLVCWNIPSMRLRRGWGRSPTTASRCRSTMWSTSSSFLSSSSTSSLPWSSSPSRNRVTKTTTTATSTRTRWGHWQSKKRFFAPHHILVWTQSWPQFVPFDLRAYRIVEWNKIFGREGWGSSLCASPHTCVNLILTSVCTIWPLCIQDCGMKWGYCQSKMFFSLYLILNLDEPHLDLNLYQLIFLHTWLWNRVRLLTEKDEVLLFVPHHILLWTSSWPHFVPFYCYAYRIVEWSEVINPLTQNVHKTWTLWHFLS